MASLKNGLRVLKIQRSTAIKIQEQFWPRIEAIYKERDRKLSSYETW